MLLRFGALTSITLIILSSLCGCISLNAAPIVPYVPPEYYNCTETDTVTLYNAYYSRYANISMAAVEFDNQYYVFKNIKLEAPMLKTINDGYFWVAYSQIKCYLAHPADMKRFKAGDKVDVVGFDIGVKLNEAGLVFKDTLVMPAGTVQLPGPGGGGANIPTY